MNTTIKNYEDVDSWKTIMFLYNAALKEVGTKLEDVYKRQEEALSLEVRRSSI